MTTPAQPQNLATRLAALAQANEARREAAAAETLAHLTAAAETDPAPPPEPEPEPQTEP